MSQTSDLISEDNSCPESQATFSEQYTDEGSQCMTGNDLGQVPDEEWPISTGECPTHAWTGVDLEQRCAHMTHWSGIEISDDDIEIIHDPTCNHYHHLNDVFYIDPVTAQSLLRGILSDEQHPANLHIHVDTRTKRQRFIGRAVMIISMTMFTVSVLLVMISLIMSDHIDDLVRNANNLLTAKPTKTDIGITTTAATNNTTRIEDG